LNKDFSYFAHMQKKNLFYFFLFITTIASAQIGGRYTYQFLNLISSPRQAALGGKVITNYDQDVTQALFNPASINYRMDNHLSLNYVNYLGDVNYGSASYAYTWDRRVQTFHAGVTYVSYGQFDGYDEQGNETGSFTGNEIALSMGYAYNIPWTDIHIGGNAKFINSKLEQYNSFGGAVDLGIMYINKELELNIALAARNLGFQFTTYAGLQEQLPFELIFGISQKLEHVPIRWHLTFENLQQWNIAFANPNRAEQSIEGSVTEEKVTFLKNLIRHTIVGMEVFPDKGFNIRLGYNFRRGEELKIVDQRNFSGITAGFGLKINKFKFDYTYARYSIAANTSMFGVTVNLQ